MRRVRKAHEPYEGPVYCVRVPTGCVLTRRNGKVSVTGNCHTMAAPTFQTTGGFFTAKLRLGLSATPNRWDGRCLLIRAHIGPVKVTAKGVPMVPVVGMYDSPWRCPRRRDSMGIVETIPHSATACGHILNLLVRHEGRNELLLERLMSAYSHGRITAVFSDRKAHLEMLRSACIRRGAAVTDTCLYVSGMKKGERQAAATKRLIFATYQMMGTGTDIDVLDVGVLATPRSNIKQIVGRVVRSREGKAQPVIIDIADDDSPVFKGWRKSRLKAYRQMGATVKYPNQEN